MKRLAAWIGAAMLWTGMAAAQSPVSVAVDLSAAPGSPIPSDFLGLSFGMKALLVDSKGGHFFSPGNTALVQIFKNLGLRHLRLGGTTVESPPATPIPDEADIDSLFAFAKAAGVQKVIYSLRLLETNASLNYAATNAALAKYITGHYASQLEAFALGNEPDLRRVYKQDSSITDFNSYLAKWKRFADAITAAVPEAKFAGPDGGSGNASWTTRFAKARRADIITEHFYVGGAGRDVKPERGIADMLSPAWEEADEKLYQKAMKPVVADGLPFRFTEANDHYSGGVSNASDTFAGALWALDFLHWWAAHGVKGVDFHNTMWVVNDVITRGRENQPVINPKGYGLKAFDLGSHGAVAPVKISSVDKINLTAYAVKGGDAIWVTVINKEYGPAGRGAVVDIRGTGDNQNAEAIFLAASDNNVAAKTGITLGGEAIRNNQPWQGKWEPCRTHGIKVPPASAVIVRLSVK